MLFLLWLSMRAHFKTVSRSKIESSQTSNSNGQPLRNPWCSIIQSVMKKFQLQVHHSWTDKKLIMWRHLSLNSWNLTWNQSRLVLSHLTKDRKRSSRVICRDQVSLIPHYIKKLKLPQSIVSKAERKTSFYSLVLEAMKLQALVSLMILEDWMSLLLEQSMA